MKNILLFILISLCVQGHAQIITTVAGTDSNGYNGDNIQAITAELQAPYDVALDGKGDFYIADGYNNRIRKVDIAGIITTIAGNGSGGYNGDNILAANAQIFRPAGIICDRYGNIYFADALNNRVRKIDTAGIITTVAGNGIGGYNGDNIAADSAQINDPHWIAIDFQGNLYITDFENHRIRMVNTTGIITTIAGTGTMGYTGDNGLATAAEINGPYSISLDGTGNVFFTDIYENVVRKIDTSGVITTFAGEGTGSSIGDNGPADSARLDGPTGLAIDSNNNIYIADAYHSRVRKVITATGIITTIAGNGIAGFSGDNGLATNAEINEPDGISIDAAGNMYFADFNNSRIRRVGWPEGINKLSAPLQSLTVYPNPSQDLFTINVVAYTNEQAQIIIINAIGQTVKEISTFTNTLTTVQLNQQTGIYYLSAITLHGITNKVINIIK